MCVCQFVHLCFCAVPPVISVPRNEYTLNIGDSVSVPCSAIGQPEPEMQWHKLGGPGEGGANLLTFTNGTMHLENAQLKHAGVYTCTALNSAGRASHDITLILHGQNTHTHRQYMSTHMWHFGV